jgi:Tfp pilus assembly protein PilN
MIEINLLPGQKRKAPGGGGFKLPNFGALLTQVKDPWLLGAIGAAVVGLGGNVALWLLTTATLAQKNHTLEGVRVENRRYEGYVAKKRNSERVRDSLSAEMTIIRGIDADRYVWPHLLDQITKALPPYTWITNVQTVGATATNTGQPATTPVVIDTTGGAIKVSIDGRTVDIQAYTTFLRQLAASPWLVEVTPTNAGTVIESDRPVTAFNVTVRYRVADSLYIRTVPLVQSVR